jgi:acylphosphatase
MTLEHDRAVPPGYNPRFAMLVGRRYVVSGRVQGVGFRFFVHDAAAREGVAGWVRNRDDGCVEIEAQGDADAMTRFEMSIRRGPRGARVDDVTVDLAPASATRQTFTIEP